jgi:hypothetical protein
MQGFGSQRTPLAFQVHLLRQKKRHLRISPEEALTKLKAPVHWTSKHDHAADIENELFETREEKLLVEAELKELPTGSVSAASILRTRPVCCTVLDYAGR